MAQISTTADPILRLLDREIWIVVSASDGKRGGLSATWVCPASIDPDAPLMLAGLAPNHFTTELVREAGRFMLHLVRADQAQLALSFAIGSSRERDKFAELATEQTQYGMPRLVDCLAWLECELVDQYDGGDRIYFWGSVVASGRASDGQPLRESQLIAAANADQLAALKANRMADIEVQRAILAEWKRSR